MEPRLPDIRGNITCNTLLPTTRVKENTINNALENYCTCNCRQQSVPSFNREMQKVIE